MNKTQTIQPVVVVCGVVTMVGVTLSGGSASVIHVSS